MPKISTSNIPRTLICKLTLKLYQDPVRAKDGHIYDRKAITDWLSNNDNLSPETKKPIKPELTDHPKKKLEVDNFLKTNNILTFDEFFSLLTAGDINELQEKNYLESYLTTENKDGLTPIAWAIKNLAILAIVFLKQELDDIQAQKNLASFKQQHDHPKDNKSSLLHIAINENKYDIAASLLKENPNLAKTTDSNHWTPLHCAVYNNQLQLVELLFQYGADPNTQDHTKATPLFTAIWNKEKVNVPMVETLLINGASPIIKDSFGLMPFEGIGSGNHSDFINTYTVMLTCYPEYKYLLELIHAKIENPDNEQAEKHKESLILINKCLKQAEEFPPKKQFLKEKMDVFIKSRLDTVIKNCQRSMAEYPEYITQKPIDVLSIDQIKDNNILGLNYYKMERYTDACHFFYQMLTILLKQALPNESILASAHYNLAKSLNMLGYFEEALFFSEKSLLLQTLSNKNIGKDTKGNTQEITKINLFINTLKESISKKQNTNNSNQLNQPDQKTESSEPLFTPESAIITTTTTPVLTSEFAATTSTTTTTTSAITTTFTPVSSFLSPSDITSTTTSTSAYTPTLFSLPPSASSTTLTKGNSATKTKLKELLKKYENKQYTFGLPVKFFDAINKLSDELSNKYENKKIFEKNCFIAVYGSSLVFSLLEKSIEERDINLVTNIPIDEIQQYFSLKKNFNVKYLELWELSLLDDDGNDNNFPTITIWYTKAKSLSKIPPNDATCHAVFYNLFNHKIIQTHPQGLNDIENKIIRVIPDEKFDVSDRLKLCASHGSFTGYKLLVRILYSAVNYDFSFAADSIKLIQSAISHVIKSENPILTPGDLFYWSVHKFFQQKNAKKSFLLFTSKSFLSTNLILLFFKIENIALLKNISNDIDIVRTLYLSNKPFPWSREHHYWFIWASILSNLTPDSKSNEDIPVSIIDKATEDQFVLVGRDNKKLLDQTKELIITNIMIINKAKNNRHLSENTLKHSTAVTEPYMETNETTKLKY